MHGDSWLFLGFVNQQASNPPPRIKYDIRSSLLSIFLSRPKSSTNEASSRKSTELFLLLWQKSKCESISICKYCLRFYMDFFLPLELSLAMFTSHFVSELLGNKHCQRIPNWQEVFLIKLQKDFTFADVFSNLAFATIEKIASERKLKGSICSNSRNSPINCQESSQKNPIRNGVCHKMSI